MNIQQTSDARSTLRAARKVAGFSRQGVMPSRSVLNTALNRLEREFPLSLSTSKDLFRSMLQTNTLPAEISAKNSLDEIKELLLQIPRQRENLSDDDDTREEQFPTM